MRVILWLNTYLNLWRIIPVFLFFEFNRFHKKCEEDLDVWVFHSSETRNHSRFIQLGYILVNQKETRNIFLNRLHRNPVMYVITRILFPPLESLYINMPPEKIGGGFSVQHGFQQLFLLKKSEKVAVFSNK